jgi:hypothetical protein
MYVLILSFSWGQKLLLNPFPLMCNPGKLPVLTVDYFYFIPAMRIHIKILCGSESRMHPSLYVNADLDPAMNMNADPDGKSLKKNFFI